MPIETTQGYKDNVHNNVTTWKGSVKIDFSDYNIDNSITVINNNPDRLTDDIQIANGVETPTFEWWSWNHFKWSQHLRSELSTSNEKGALGERLSSAGNLFNNRVPKIFGGAVFSDKTIMSNFIPQFILIVQFLPRTITQLKVVFDSILQEYGVDFDFFVKNGITIVHTSNVTNNSSYVWQADITPVLGTSIELVIKKWNKAFAKPKIIEMFTSLQQEYNQNDIVSIRTLEESDPQDATLPIGNVTANKCNIRLINISNTFDNDNQQSILYNNITKNRRIKPFITLCNHDEIPLGVFYSTKWLASEKGLYVDISGRDIIGMMQDFEYTKSQFITPSGNQVFIYTTTAEFDTFILDNIISTNNELQFKKSALVCSNSGFPINLFGGKVFSSLTVFSGFKYCGYAEKQITYSYTPGTSITVDISSNVTVFSGENINYYISYKTNEEWNEVENFSFNFTPENIASTTQNLKVRIAFSTSNINSNISLQDITITIKQKVTLYSLASKVIQEFDSITNLIEGNYIIAEEFGEYEIPTAYLSPNSYRNILSVIVAAGAGRAYQRRDQVLVLETIGITDNPPDKTYTNNLIFNVVKPTNSEDLYNQVSVKVNALRQSINPEQVASVDIEIENTEVQTLTVFFDVEPTDTITYSGLPSGVTITDSTEYTWGVDIEITNASGSNQSFILTVNGKPYKIVGKTKIEKNETESQRKNGIISLTIDNPLIQTKEQAELVATILIDSLSQQKREIVLDVHPDPSLLVGDTISENGNNYIIQQIDLDYGNSGLNQTIRGKK